MIVDDLTLDAEIRYALLWPGHCEQPPRPIGVLSNLTPDGEYNFEMENDFYEYQE